MFLTVGKYKRDSSCLSAVFFQPRSQGRWVLLFSLGDKVAVRTGSIGDFADCGLSSGHPANFIVGAAGGIGLGFRALPVQHAHNMNSSGPGMYQAIYLALLLSWPRAGHTCHWPLFLGCFNKSLFFHLKPNLRKRDLVILDATTLFY